MMNLKSVFHTRQRQDSSILPTTNNYPVGSNTGGVKKTKMKGFTRYLWGHQPITYSHSRPTFKQWLVATYPDLITLVVCGALELGIYLAPAPFQRNFPITHSSSGDIVYPSLAHPIRDQIIPSYAAGLVSFGLPILTVLLFNLVRIRSFWDVNNAVLGILYSLLLATLFQVSVKTLVGGLRPDWLAVCQPDIDSLLRVPGTDGDGDVGLDGVVGGFGSVVMYTAEICTNEDAAGIKNAMESFPSGHATTAFAGFGFLFLYINAKLKVWSDYHSSVWKLAVLYAPMLVACLVGGSLTVDQSHHWYDVVAGAVIGTVFAFSAYRVVYAAVWDWRFNHIPLHRGKAFDYDGWEENGEEGGELMDAVLTRKAGWGGGDVRRFGRLRRQVGSDEVGKSTGVVNGREDGGDGVVGQMEREERGLRPPQTMSGRPSSSLTMGDGIV